MPTASLRPEAEVDLAGLDDYIRRHSDDAADRFAVAVDGELRRLAEWSGMGAPREVDSPELAGLRVAFITGYKRYLVFYLPTEDGVDVLRVVDGSMDIPAFRRRGPARR